MAGERLLGAGTPMTDAAFYCVADARYFLGAVGLVNSLRLVGHSEPIYLLDCGLTEAQRELLATEAEIVAAAGDTPPWLTKTVLPLSRPAEAMVLLDTDMIVTRSLGELIGQAAQGRLVAFADPLDRFVGEWGELLGLGAAVRGPYVSSAALLAGREIGLELLGMLDRHQAIVEFERTFWRANEPGYAFTYADQDVLNAILATRAERERERVRVLDERLAATPPFDGLKLLDTKALRCSYADGVGPYLVHHHVVRPWLEPTGNGIYSRLLRRLLLGDDVAIKLGEERLPPWLRTGVRAWAMRARVSLRERYGP